MDWRSIGCVRYKGNILWYPELHLLLLSSLIGYLRYIGNVLSKVVLRADVKSVKSYAEGWVLFRVQTIPTVYAELIFPTRYYIVPHLKNAHLLAPLFPVLYCMLALSDQKNKKFVALAAAGPNGGKVSSSRFCCPSFFQILLLLLLFFCCCEIRWFNPDFNFYLLG